MKNRTILETLQALAELNNTKLPAMVSYRIGLNLNSIRSIADVIEETRKKLVEEHKVGLDQRADKEYEQRFEQFEKAWNEVLQDDTEWTPKTTFPFKLIDGVKEFQNAAQLLAAGILTE